MFLPQRPVRQIDSSQRIPEVCLNPPQPVVPVVPPIAEFRAVELLELVTMEVEEAPAAPVDVVMKEEPKRYLSALDILKLKNMNL